jgi:monovalent cation:H+ antiporter-2, CPA2 family
MGTSYTCSVAGAYEFLQALTIVLGIAALTTIAFQRLRQPVVLGYLLAGVLIGPYVPFPLVADPVIVHTLSELGVILLMFALGLEFSLRRLLRVGASAAVTAIIECSVMIWLGSMTARALGWSSREALFAGAIVAISSTTIIAKAFDERNVRGRLRELVVGILVVEDLIAILLMATLTAISTGAGLSAGGLAQTAGRLGGFLIGLVGIGLVIVPRVMRAVVRLGRSETTLVASIALCFGVAVLAHEFGYSVALGAFLAGSLAAESGEGEKIAELVRPVRDMFAAIFFVSVGMAIDPSILADHWPAVLILSVVVVAGKMTGVSIGAFLGGNGTRTSVAAGMSLAQIGEFSFIIAGLGAALHATRNFLYPVAVAVSALTTLATPWLIRASGPAANFVDRKLPRPIQTFASLYGSWLEELKNAPRRETLGARVRRLGAYLALDVALLAALVIGTSLELDTIARMLSTRFNLQEHVAGGLVIAGAAVLAVPFCVGIYGLARRLGILLAEMALPGAADGKADLGRAPRRALIVTLQLAWILVAVLPLIAVTQQFVSGFPVIAVLLPAILALGVAFWRTATDLQGHVRAGAQMIVEALAVHSTSPGHEMDEVHRLLPGMGEPVSAEIPPASAAIGRSLAQLNLRGATGATVLAITRADGNVPLPTAGEVLRAGDVLALAGTHEAIEAALRLLRDRAPDQGAPLDQVEDGGGREGGHDGHDDQHREQARTDDPQVQPEVQDDQLHQPPRVHQDSK